MAGKVGQNPLGVSGGYSAVGHREAVPLARNCTVTMQRGDSRLKKKLKELMFEHQGKTRCMVAAWSPGAGL